MKLLRETIRKLILESSITYESGYLQRDGIFHVTAYADGKQIGTMGLHYLDPAELQSDCKEDYERVIRELDFYSRNHGTPRSSSFRKLEVFDVGVDSEYQNQGIGTTLYEKALQLDGGNVILVASKCVEGSTSYDAERVWRRLAKKYVSSGFILASLIDQDA